MDNGTLASSLHQHFLTRRHSTLLVAIVAFFTARPMIGDVGIAPVVFSLALIVLMLVALYTIQVDELVGERETLLLQKRRRSIIGWLLVIPAIGDRLAILFVHSPRLILAGAIFWLVFFGFITWNELRAVVKQREVTGETICMAISVYLLLGFTWAFLYDVMFQLHPESFGGLPSAQPGHPMELLHIFPILGYFSLTTLSTVGFGDITPLTLQARYAAVAEGITGQFYLAILVARLVGLQMTRSAVQHTE
jgi:ion channel